LQEEHTIRAHALAFWKLSKMVLDLSPPLSTWLCYAWALTHVRKYAWILRALVLNILMVPSDETPIVFHLFRPNKGQLHLSYQWFPSKVILNQETYIFTWAHSLHISLGSLLGMVYELLWNYFVPNDFTNGFDMFLKYVGTLLVYHV